MADDRHLENNKKAPFIGNGLTDQHETFLQSYA